MIRILLFTFLFIVSSFGLASAAVAQGQEERDIQKSIHPCGGPGLMLDGITGYFIHKWRARYGDLNSQAVRAWINHHNAHELEITLVRVFRSSAQPRMVVVSARKFINYLNGKPLVEMMCIVKMPTGKITDFIGLEYTEPQLQEILSGGEVDI